MLMPSVKPLGELENPSEFVARHIGVTETDERHMLSVIGEASRRALIDSIVPRAIARRQGMQLPAPLTEAAALAELKGIAQKNKLLKSFIGQGYHGTHTPGVILRNILENPAWYTAYTPYQAEISQGRLEALLNFQTMVTDLTGMAIANASMLDEATAAAEAMTLAKRSVKARGNAFVVSGDVHPQTIEVIQTRAAPLGLEVRIAMSGEEWNSMLAADDYFAAFTQYPASSGWLHDWTQDAAAVHGKQAAFIVAADLLALTLLKPPGEMGADIVVGTTQRFGVPMGYGGPHAAYMACRDEFKRSLPGRLVGVSVDAHGKPAYRLALQTREQHIRREKATSNICTAQVLLAVIAGMYAVYHGPHGLKRIAQRVAAYTAILAKGLAQLGYTDTHHGEQGVFDTVCLHTDKARTDAIAARAVAHGANLRKAWDEYLIVTLDETTTREDIVLLWRIFAKDGQALPSFDAFEKGVEPLIPEALRRSSAYLTHPVFNTHHSETGMLRYIRMLSDKDLALDRSMIPLGSCTMKLNATSEMIPITWPEFANVHPFAPADQREGYTLLDQQLRDWLCEATGYAGISLQPNAGSQGEYAGLLVIQAWHRSRGEGHRNICLIPSSAHGTNPASAQMVGMQVVVTRCDENGNVDLADLKAKCELHSKNLAAVMITYPSTHGVFETQVKELCALVHQHGGRVYVDGANMNALVGVAAPGEFGADVCHLNLHKTFCIPHGGGGPGVGPICVVEDLVPFLPGHAAGGLPVNGVGAISAAPLGNAAVLPISWMYIRMMGAEGLQRATEAAILSANYISTRLKDHFPTLYASANGHVAHECILDLRDLKDSSGVMAEDVAKRLIDYGFHAPTLSFPVANTLMVEPTESETLEEIDRFIDAMIAIREEIRRIEKGEWPQDDNPLKHAPHTAASLLKGEWTHAYPRDAGAAVLDTRAHAKYWPPVGRVDNVYGDRNLFCSCVPMGDLAD
ncbi:MAG: aminomethyl-transferring glycine dehydrogenase [Hydrogenophaga sp.]|uniref:aminomethyl-transferring glycine dehydrogenase n=1 Tax=Hydrogenophaga sp. TaxID=1904254 RepID=UPI0016AEE512|nr:aminomethyl-transferring glycine dehydrogenase [Hydrogenophaga sp.]NIM40674.1 aminomethyl-transferring glycine dehydrogenase [Hydrogenophaga sp.]NIN26149.1 aminomethyl-transferring glycine dehydrogenase [Hydrogenophaga sp.]NIN31014.1 aminomethyl-transferring glycine dehydrogenase [Hydrogenophaga sp.]NIN55057.1 aminomethyl-transferring glycine dehydrogenase [Hydrogenophaga sp.]NIO51100.1 aminomethyl-transferring glycine dehydrogenase [Hydrogenophaga sp.]